jgi:hypothetical protein
MMMKISQWFLTTFLGIALTGQCVAQISANLAAIAMQPLFRVVEVQGTAQVVSPSGDQQKAQPSQLVFKNDHIVTGADGQVTLELTDGGLAEVGPDQNVMAEQLALQPDGWKASAMLWWGRVMKPLKKLTIAESSFEIEAGGVVAAVRGSHKADPLMEKIAVGMNFQQPIMTLIRGEGHIQVLREGLEGKLKLPLPLYMEDRLVTAPGSKAVLELPDGGLLEVGDGQSLAVGQIDTHPDSFRGRFLLIWGRLKHKLGLI